MPRKRYFSCSDGSRPLGRSIHRQVPEPRRGPAIAFRPLNVIGPPKMRMPNVRLKACCDIGSLRCYRPGVPLHLWFPLIIFLHMMGRPPRLDSTSPRYRIAITGNRGLGFVPFIWIPPSFTPPNVSGGAPGLELYGIWARFACHPVSSVDARLIGLLASGKRRGTLKSPPGPCISGISDQLSLGNPAALDGIAVSYSGNTA